MVRLAMSQSQSVLEEARWEGGQAVRAMTPKEQIEQFMRGEWTQGGFNRTFGYYGVNWQEGAFEIHWQATEAFTTGQMEAIHGGAIAG